MGGGGGGGQGGKGGRVKRKEKGDIREQKGGGEAGSTTMQL